MAHVDQCKIWACVSDPDHLCKTRRKLFPCGLSGRWFNVVSKLDDKDPDYQRYLSVMYLVATFYFFETWVLHEFNDMNESDDDVYFYYLLVSSFNPSHNQDQPNSLKMPLLNSYYDSRLLLQIPSSLLMDPYTTYEFVSITPKVQNNKLHRHLLFHRVNTVRTNQDSAYLRFRIKHRIRNGVRQTVQSYNTHECYDWFKFVYSTIWMSLNVPRSCVPHENCST